MTQGDAARLKARMRADLVEAMKAKRTEEVPVLRSLLAAIDNAEAPDIASQPKRVLGGSNEVERRELSATELEAILLGEIAERERAAAELAGLGQAERAEALLLQAAIAKRYVR